MPEHTAAVLGVIGGVLLTLSYFPYIYHILKRQSEPHIFTWVLWTLTQVVATTAILEGSGGIISTIALGSGAFLSALVLLLSLHYGSRNITRFDTAALALGLGAVFMWWQLDHPVVAVFLITFIDVVAFLPTYRKTWYEPWSESLTAWALFLVGNICIIFSLEAYNLLTIVYIGTVTVASLLLVVLSKHRRRLFGQQ